MPTSIPNYTAGNRELHKIRLSPATLGRQGTTRSGKKKYKSKKNITTGLAKNGASAVIGSSAEITDQPGTR